MNQEILNEERYQNTKKTMSKIGKIILVGGVLLGGLILATGIIKQTDFYKEKKIEKLNEKLVNEQKILENKKAELENKGITYNIFTEYTDKEAYTLKVIVNAMNPSYSHCNDEYTSNSVTANYCKIKNQIYEARNGFSSTGSANIAIGAMILFISLGVGGMILMTSKQRDILAYGIQTGMPLAQEGIEKMAPTIGKAGKEIVKEMAPVYGEVAREISKGIKDGLKDNEEGKK